MPRILFVFSSLFGANVALGHLAMSALDALGAEVRVRRVPEVALAQDVQPVVEEVELATAADLAWADGFILSSPPHSGLLSASMKAFVDANHDAAVAGDFVNTTFTAMATSNFAHAGQERVVDDLNAIGAAWGCILVPPSTANTVINKLDGNPYGLSFVLQHGRLADEAIAAEAIGAHLERFVAITTAVRDLRATPVADSALPTAAAVFS